ncbi:MAG: glycoside hydrolase family 5 protein [Thiohalocapsa sp.]
MATSPKSSTGWAAAILALIAGLAVLLGPQAGRAAVTGSSCQFRRGVNLPLEFTGWQYSKPAGRAAAAARIRNVAAAGFDFVRVVINLRPLLTGGDATPFIAQLVDFAGQAAAAHLCVVLAPSPPEWDPAWRSQTVLADPGKTARYRGLLVEIAQALGREPPAAALELLNEPPFGCNGQAGIGWDRIQVDLYSAIRRVAPRLPVVLTGDCWSSLDALIKLEAKPFAGDPNALFTFHFYEPSTFAEQGAAFKARCPTAQLSGVEYPATTSCLQTALAKTRQAVAGDLANSPNRNACEHTAAVLLTQYCQRLGFPSYIKQRMALVRHWADAAGLPPDRVFAGEFGAITQGKAGRGGAWPDRLRWLADVRAAAEAEGFGWAVWALGAAFTIECPGGPPNAVCPAAAAALGLRQ